MYNKFPLWLLRQGPSQPQAGHYHGSPPFLAYSVEGEGDGQRSALENAYIFLPWSPCILLIIMYVFEYWHEQATACMAVRLKGSYTELYFSVRTLDT